MDAANTVSWIYSIANSTEETGGACRFAGGSSRVKKDKLRILEKFWLQEVDTHFFVCLALNHCMMRHEGDSLL